MIRDADPGVYPIKEVYKRPLSDVDPASPPQSFLSVSPSGVPYTFQHHQCVYCPSYTK